MIAGKALKVLNLEGIDKESFELVVEFFDLLNAS
jgi:hypothetical protein